MSESKEYAELENGSIKDNGTIITVTQDNGETTVKMTEGNAVQGQGNSSPITDEERVNAIKKFITDNDINAKNDSERVTFVRDEYKAENTNDNISDDELDVIIKNELGNVNIGYAGGKAKRTKKSAKKGKKSRGMKGKRGRRSAKKGRK
jgi:hypothetical protein